MCCTTPHHHPGHFSMATQPAVCGCGCIGREPSDWHLENYKTYLKAELESVEKQIRAIRKKKA